MKYVPSFTGRAVLSLAAAVASFVSVTNAQIQSGQVHLNYPDWDPNAPFGGYKRSGNGREYGCEGMEEYLETKAVLGFYQ